MTLDIKHPFFNEKPDGGDTTIVRPSDWNNAHSIIMSPGVVGRTTSGDGAASVLPLVTEAAGIPSSDNDTSLPTSAAVKDYVDGYVDGPLTTLTIASGAITVTGRQHSVETEGAIPLDELTTINGGVDGLTVMLRLFDVTDHVRVRHGVGNIHLATGTDCYLGDDYNQFNIVLAYAANVSKWIEVSRSTYRREVLTAARNYNVRYQLGEVAMTIATPSVVTTLIPHNLSVNDPVVFHLPFDAENSGVASSISIDTPGVVDFGAPHGFAANDPIRLWFTRTPPSPLANATPYYVKTVLSANTFTLSATPGGAEIATTGAFVGYVKVERWSLLPSGNEVVEGQIYYVKTIPTSTSITFSDTPGGTAIATSGTLRGKITMQTGKDTNSGLTLLQEDALLTPQRAYDLLTDLDLNDKSCAIACTASKYRVVDGPVVGCYRTTAVIDPEPSNTPVGGGKITVIGEFDRPSNVVFQAINFPVVEVFGNTEAFLRFNFLTIEGDPGTGYMPGLNVLQTSNPVYCDYVAFRGELGELVAASQAKIWVHGTVEVFSDVLFDIFSAYGNDGFISFVDPGGGYFQGIILYGTMNPASSILFAGGGGGIFLSAQFNNFEGTFGVPWAWVSNGTIQAGYPYADPAGAAWLKGDPAVYRGGTISVQYVAAGPYYSTVNSHYWIATPQTVADLDPPGVVGRKAYVTDANATTFNSVVAGGGSNKLGVQDDGTDWRIG